MRLGIVASFRLEEITTLDNRMFKESLSFEIENEGVELLLLKKERTVDCGCGCCYCRRLSFEA